MSMCNALLVGQVTDLEGLEAGELRGKVGSNVLDNTVVSLTGSDIELAPHLRHAGMLSAAHVCVPHMASCVQKHYAHVCVHQCCS